MQDSSNLSPLADLLNLARNVTVEGAAWSVKSADLNANLVVLEMQNIGEHVNVEVDVLVVGVLGDGTVSVDGVEQPFGAGYAVLVPKGARRAFRAEGGRFAYLTVHRRRQGLWPTPL